MRGIGTEVFNLYSQAEIWDDEPGNNGEWLGLLWNLDRGNVAMGRQL